MLQAKLPLVLLGKKKEILMITSAFMLIYSNTSVYNPPKAHNPQMLADIQQGKENEK